ncbi:hypothetical protein MRB53_038667 [Persea americana]|nr:hypothetical protein MRB53_038667 [Persea americana]
MRGGGDRESSPRRTEDLRNIYEARSLEQDLSVWEKRLEPRRKIPDRLETTSSDVRVRGREGCSGRNSRFHASSQLLQSIKSMLASSLQERRETRSADKRETKLPEEFLMNMTIPMQSSCVGSHKILSRTCCGGTRVMLEASQGVAVFLKCLRIPLSSAATRGHKDVA